jgi:hypothetical protein
MPNIMLEKGLSCKGCHIFHEESGGKLIKSDTYVSKGQACESCHGSGFSRLLKDWEISIAKKLAQIQVILSQTRREIEASTGAEKEKALGLMEEAVFNIELVKRGKSVHNMAYSQALLSAAYDMMVSSLGIIGSPYQPPVFISKAENIPTECSNCHAGIEEIGTRIFGLNFSHKNHLTAQKIDCSRCHSNVRTHGEFIASKQSCATCHHKETARSCETCHSLQAAFYQGGQVLGRSIPKDMMAEAEVKCVDCHLDENGQIERSSQVQCIGCHSEGYGELFAEWQDRIRSLNNSLRSRLNQKKKQHLAPNERAEIEAIERFCDNVDLDGSSGIHNYLYIEETLTSLKEKIE